MKKHWFLRAVCLLCALALAPVAGLAETVQITNLPTVYITLNDGKTVDQITKTDRLPGTLSLAAGEQSFADAAITIKGRGNSTWQLPKKPYQIKFESKTDLLGMGKAKKWVLLANYWDKTLLRNAVTYDLANKTDKGFSVEWRFVDLVINGEYRGNYLLTEKIEFDKQRINQSTENGAVLMELEQQYRHANEGCAACVVTGSGVHVTLKEPEVDETFTQAQLEEVKQTCLDRLNVIEGELIRPLDRLEKAIDVDSFVNWYIQNELAKNYDAAFVTSCHCYLDEDGLLHMGPVWDVDVCFGNQDVIYPETTDNGLNDYNYRADKGAWYLALMDNPAFVSRVKARWAEWKQAGLLQGMLDRIDELAAELARSQAMDQARWPAAMRVTNVRDQGKGHGGTVYYTYAEELAYFKDWLTRRIDFLDSQWDPAYGDLANCHVVDRVTGAAIAPLGAKTADDAWQWSLQSGGDKANRALIESYPFFADSLTGGAYVLEADFTGYTNTRNTDNLTLSVVGVTANGRKTVIKTTAGTRTTDRMAMGENGRTPLRLAVELEPGAFERYYAQVTAWNSRTTLYGITLYAPGAVVYGDVNEDGTVDAVDALWALQAAVGKRELTESGFAAANVNGDAGVDAKDALLILKKAVGKIDRFPVEA